MTVVRILGYWLEVLPPRDGLPSLSPEHAAAYEILLEQGLRWHDPRSMVDTSWGAEERDLVVGYLRAGRVAVQFRGLSRCRFCGRENGSKELSDGTFSWPEGLPHYLEEHGVRLPDEFVEHVAAGDRAWLALPTPGFDHLGQRARSWPGADLEHFLVGDAVEQHDDDTERDAGWWLAQTPVMADGP